MDPIPQDTVERAEDFFFKLDDKQVLDQIKDYEKIQPSIHKYLWVTDQIMKSPEIYILLSRFTLMFDYCFRSYPIELTIIKRDSVSYYVSQEGIKSMCPNIPETSDIDTDKALELIDQIHLTKIFKEKESLFMTEEPEEKRIIGSQIWLSLITILHLYQDEAIKQPEKF